MAIDLRRLGKKLTEYTVAPKQQAGPSSGPLLPNIQLPWGVAQPQRNIASRLYDQFNPLDNNRTFKQAAPTQNKSAFQQAGQFGGQLTRAVTRGTAGTLNTAAAQIPQVYGTGRMLLASATNNPTAFRNANQFSQAADENFRRGQGGLLNVGTFYGPEEARRGDLKTGLTSIGGGIAESGLEIGSLGVGGVAGKQLLQQGIKRGVRTQLPRLGANTVLNTAQGGVAAYNQGANLKDATKAALFSGGVGTLADVGLGVGGTVALKGGKATVKLAKPKAPLNQIGSIGKNVNESLITLKQPETISDSEWRSLVQQEPTKKMPKTSQGTTALAPLPEAKLPTQVPKTTNPIQRAFTSVRGELSRMGSGGSEVAKRLRDWRSQSEIRQQAFLDSIPTVQKLGKQFPDFVDALDSLSRGERPNISPKIAKAIQEWVQAIPEVQRLAVATGREVGDRGPYYFPRQYSELLKTRSGFNSAVNHLVQTGQAASPAEAIQQLRLMRSKQTFGNFKAREFDIPDYDKSQSALTEYISGAFDDISRAEQFGASNEIANQLLARIAEEGHDAGRASRLLDVAVGNVDKSTPGYKISGKIRQFNSLRSLGTAGISNATQLLVNTSTVAGIGKSLKGAFKTLVSPAARQQARETGVLLESAISNLANQEIGSRGVITRNIAAPFFRQIERFNRQGTAVVGSDWGNSLAKKASQGDTRAEAILRDKLRVTGEIGSKLTREQEIQASRALVEIAQFKVDPQDLPGWVDTPIGKLAAQFRTFGYKQTTFMYNEVIREALKGNFLPLGRFVTIAIPAGAGAQYIKSSIKGTKYTEEGESKTSQGLKALAAVGGFGLPGSELQNIYKSAQYGNTVGGVAGAIGGPTGGFIAESAANLDKGIQRDNWQPLIKQGVRTIPAVGSPIANRMYPKQQTANASAPKAGKAPTTEYLNKQTSEEVKKLEQTAKAGDYSLRQLSNGKYGAVIDGKVKQFEDLDKARLESRKDKFEKSDAKSKVIGDTYFYKTKAGNVKTQPKVLYEFERTSARNKLEMDRALDAKDLTSWLGLAQKQYDALETKKGYYDPETEQEEIDKITLQQENLMQKAEGYLSKGGIGGRGGRSGGGRGGRGSTGSVYKYAVSLRSGGQVAKPRVSVRKSVATRSTAKTSNSARPTVTVKKSKV